jgi:hypothetical protein
VANLNTAVAYRGILPQENVGTVINYCSIFYNIGQFSCCEMAVKYSGKSFITLVVVANLNTAVIYHGILPQENVGTAINYRSIFYNIGQFSCCGMAVKYCSKSFYNIGRGGKLKY